jgi:hypothetical protein
MPCVFPRSDHEHRVLAVEEYQIMCHVIFSVVCGLWCEQTAAPRSMRWYHMARIDLITSRINTLTTCNVFTGTFSGRDATPFFPRRYCTYTFHVHRNILYASEHCRPKPVLGKRGVLYRTDTRPLRA